DAGTGSGSSGADPPGDGAASGEVVVHVAGAVTAPGVVRLAATGRIVDAVAAAGGLRPDADPDRVNLAAPVSDGQRIVIPVLGQPLPEEVVTAAPGRTPPDGAAGSAGPAGPSPAVVDLNLATAEQLDTLPGVGPATAAAILAYREESGPFRSVDDLIEVRGIGEAKLEALRDLVVVSDAG
ncbi:MAG: helix-hairpin-helix domain-containing protein, partial [Microthrixaceae bacterium]